MGREKTNRDLDAVKVPSTVDLSTPWSMMYPNRMPARPLSGQEAIAFIDTRTALHAKYITETEKTRRLAISLAAVLLALACLVPLFAPVGRETLSYVLSAALVVFSAGAVGFTELRLSARKQQLRLSQGGTNAERS